MLAIGTTASVVESIFLVIVLDGIFAMLFASLARGQRAVYTCPIKALVNEKWMGLCREFGADVQMRSFEQELLGTAGGVRAGTEAAQSLGFAASAAAAVGFRVKRKLR